MIELVLTFKNRISNRYRFGLRRRIRRIFLIVTHSVRVKNIKSGSYQKIILVQQK
jgi:hypothetical protein